MTNRFKYYTSFDGLKCYHPDSSMDFIKLKNCIILDLNDEEMIDAIENEDYRLWSVLWKYFFEEKEIFDSCNYFDNLDFYVLQGHSIAKALRYLNQSQIEEMRNHSLYISEPACSDRGRMTAKYKEKAKECLFEINEYKKKKSINIKERRNVFSKIRNQLMLAVIDRDGYKCQHCKIDKSLTVDHIFPLSKGGSDELDNLQLLCRSCNSKKSSN